MAPALTRFSDRIGLSLCEAGLQLLLLTFGTLQGMCQAAVSLFDARMLDLA